MVTGKEQTRKSKPTMAGLPRSHLWAGGGAYRVLPLMAD